MKITQNNLNNTYSVDANGAIEINSIKNKIIFNLAKECDKDNNNILEKEEISQFLKKHAPLKNENNYSIYYQETDQAGNLTKKCFSMKSDNAQLIFFYNNNKPSKCIVNMQDGKKYTIDLSSGDADFIKNTNNNEPPTKINIGDKNTWRFERLGNEKPYLFDNLWEELAYRIINWDWE